MRVDELIFILQRDAKPTDEVIMASNECGDRPFEEDDLHLDEGKILILGNS